MSRKREAVIQSQVSVCGTVFQPFCTNLNARKVFKRSERVLRNVCVTTTVWLVLVLLMLSCIMTHFKHFSFVAVCFVFLSFFFFFSLGLG